MLNGLTYQDRLMYFYDDDPYKEPPDIFELFRFYNQAFFKDKLNSSSIKWSKKMTLCAGTCKYEGQGSSTITLSEPLLKFRSNNEIKETLIHEMIHAYWFATDPESCKVNEVYSDIKQFKGHGPKFLEMMHAINQQSQLSITVYHKFHDEVDRCRQHIWKCNGPCQYKSPYFGVVKRSMNRPPQPADNWFQMHQDTCGGQFSKVSEPQKLIKPPKQPKEKVIKQQKTKTDKTLKSYFGARELSPTTNSFIIKIMLSNDESRVTACYETHKDFNYKDLSAMLIILYKKLSGLSEKLTFQQYDFSEQIQNTKQILWKDLLSKKDITFETEKTNLQMQLIESKEKITVSTLISLNIITTYDLQYESSLVEEINQ